jgi:copper chaperone NosL
MTRRALLLALLAACAPARTEGPPAARFGSDTCARCGMIVSEPRFAAGFRSDDGASVLFDDAGEALRALRGAPELAGRLYVNDLEEAGWVPAGEALFVRAAGFATPMGTGVVAFRDSGKAATFAARQGAERPLDYAAALDQLGREEDR